MQAVKETALATFFGTLVLVWSLAGPVTYILSVVDTWHSHASVVMKLVLSLTLDVFAASIWPGTWIAWAIWHFTGSHTPLDLLF